MEVFFIFIFGFILMILIALRVTDRISTSSLIAAIFFFIIAFNASGLIKGAYDAAGDTSSPLYQFCNKYGMNYTGGASTSWACKRNDVVNDTYHVTQCDIVDVNGIYYWKDEKCPVAVQRSTQPQFHQPQWKR